MNEERVPLGELDEHVGDEVSVSGFVDNIRDLGGLKFLELRDRTGKVQVTYKPDNYNGGREELEDVLDELTPESTVRVEGELSPDERVDLRGMEIYPDDIEVTSHADSDLSVRPDSDLSKRLDWRYLDLRRPKQGVVFEVQTTAEQAMREYWTDNGFIEIHSPKLMAGASESGAELFTLDYFGEPASLAQSPQHYKQMAMAAGFERVFEVGPVFRANPSHTSRHDTEYTSVDMEMSWIDSHEDVMEFEEEWLRYVLSEVQEEHGDEIAEYWDRELPVPETPLPRISMDEAYDFLQAEGHDAISEGDDLDREAEKMLSQYAKEDHDSELIFVTDFPISARPFYHMRYEDDPETTKSFDLLWNGIEVTTGAQREHRPDRLYEQAVESELDEDSISHYVDFFRHGCPPHGGYGFGLTRMLMNVVDADNVREVTYVPRDPDRLRP